jgi:3-oxoacyl-[acyl-carrier-protein] synthase-1
MWACSPTRTRATDRPTRRPASSSSAPRARPASRARRAAARARSRRASLVEAERVLAGDVPSALVIALDSFADPAVVMSEVEEGNVKTEHNPVGYMPGEAAVVAFLRRASPTSSGALVTPPTLGTDRLAAGRKAPSDGRALAACVLDAVKHLPPAARPFSLISDHDGTPARAHELGMLQLRLAAASGTPRAIVYPALGFGRTGAASGGLALAVATRALAREAARARAYVITSAAANGARAAFAVTARHG